MRRTARSLQLAVPIDWRFAQGVTPQILSKDVAVQMGHWIQARFMEDSWTSFLLEIILHDKARHLKGPCWDPCICGPSEAHHWEFRCSGKCGASSAFRQHHRADMQTRL